jgi:4-methyl-5(b-hydroxyethyl)-thiazole monophosphate biosynthesis
LEVIDVKVFVMLADGFEEIEALSVVDVLRRGDVETTTVSVKNDKIVLSAHNIPVVADVTIDRIDVGQEDMIVLPGGSKGVEGLGASETLMNLLKEHHTRKGWISAICAGPVIPGKLGCYKGIKAICYPGCEGDLIGAVISDEDVVAEQNFVTAKGPGVSLPFAFKLLEIIKGSDTMNKIRTAMIFK